MKWHRRTGIFALSLFASLATFAVSAADNDKIRNLLRENMPGVEIGEIRPAPISGLVEVAINGKDLIYVDDKAELAFKGAILDLGKKLNLTQQRVDEIRKVDFSSLPLDKAIVKVKGNGARKLALFSDPDCPYCQQLERELVNITDVTIYTFLYPLTSIHPDATRKSSLIWCAGDRARVWDDWMLTGKDLPKDVAKCDTPIPAIEALGKKLGIDGTPGIVFANGKLVEGAIPRQQIEALLGGK